MAVSIPSFAGEGVSSAPKIPSAIASTMQSVKPITPSYHGPSFNSIQHVANSIGASYSFDPVTGQAKVNNSAIKPTSIVNGTPHAPVAQVAQAAGHPSPLVQSSATNTTIYPAASTQQNGMQLNNYWQGIQQNGHTQRTVLSGEKTQDVVNQEAQKYHVDPSQVQVIHQNGKDYVRLPWQDVSAYAYAQSNPQAQQPQQPSPGYGDQIGALGQGFLNSVYGSAPQAPTLTPIPMLDTSQIQPFQWNSAQDMMNQYQAQLPAFNQQLQSADQKINEGMNARGLFNSGIAQQDVDTQNQALYGKLFDSIQKNSLADQKQSYTEYQGQVSNYLNAYKANVDAMYKNGQLTNQQYSDAINEWGKAVSAAQNVFDQQSKQLLDAQSQDASMAQKLIPYTYGPTPYQQQQLDLNQFKALLPYQMPTAYQQGQLDLGQQKLATQIQQWQAQDQMRQEQIMGYDAQGNPTLARQKFDEQQQMDGAKIAEIQNKAQSTAYHDQAVNVGRELGSIDSQIKAVLASTMDATTRQSTLTQLYSQRDSLFGQLDTINLSLGGSSTTDLGNSTLSPN